MNVFGSSALLSVVVLGSACFGFETDSLKPFPVLKPVPESLQNTQRGFDSAPSVTVSRGGRVWVAWHAGGKTEGEDNAVLVATSGDDGKSWSQPLFALDAPGPLRGLDPGLWTDSSGKVWLFYAQIYSFWDGRGGVWAMNPDDPERADTTWSAPRRLCDGFMKNKPIELADGRWLLPVEFMNANPISGFLGKMTPMKGPEAHPMPEMMGADIFESRDRGKTVTFLGKGEIPKKARDCTENMVYQKRDGTLRQLVRTSYGIGESVSRDGGRTWTEVVPSNIQNPSSRFFIGRLRSGALLLVKNGPVDRRTDRRELTAFVSDDDGTTWTGGLVLDARRDVSYPDAAQDGAGRIHVVNDHERTKAREILHHVFTEADVRAGRLVSAGSRLGDVVTAAPRKVIFDTDMYTDFDDTGALAILHALADAGECEILGTLVSTSGGPSAGMVEILNAFYGRPDLPIGRPVGMGMGVGHDRICDPTKDRSFKIYSAMVANAPGVRYRDSATAPDANGVYRRLLADAPDGSVTIVTTGFTTNMRRLLETKADDISPLDGKALVAKKVRAWCAMACRFPDGEEYNSKADAESSRIAFGDWPTPIYFLDYMYGKDVRCGRPAARLADGGNPVREVFSRALKAYGEWDTGHPSWDELAVLAAVRGPERHFGTRRGRFTIVNERGANHWEDDPNGNHYLLTVRTDRREMADIIDELICREPKRGAAEAYDVAAYVWPAYQPEPRWAELGIFEKGIGEWQNVQEARPKWPGHRQPMAPLWGYENEADPKVVAKKIDAASAAGVNVFIYDWYWYGGRPFLENALNEGFLKAPNRGKMKFFVMWANHHVDRIWDNKAADKQGDKPLWRGWVSDEEFRALVPRWIGKYFREPNYYRIQGRPVFMIYNLGIFIEGVGGEAKAAAALDFLRVSCREAGLGGVHLMTCDRRGLKNEWIERLGIDSASTYTFRMWSDPEGNRDYAPWAEKAMERFDAAKGELKGLKAYFAHACAGWDTNPRYPASVKASTAVNATPAKFEKVLRRAKDWCDRNTPEGYPRLITLNSWNEWTEGAVLEPDTEFGFGYLEAVRRVFRPGATNGAWRVFNEDNDRWFCQAKPDEVNEAGLRAYIDGIADTAKPTHMFLCPCGQRASFDSKAWEPIWAGLNDPDASGKTNHPWCANAKRLHDQGVDAYATWIDQCRRRGISPWLSMRMNDDHIMVIPHYFRNETFWRENPQFRKHPELDPWAPDASRNWSLYSYDYSHPEVRDHQFAMFKELVWRYDADGIEIDWLRTPGVFAPGKEKEGLKLLTAFMRRCRREADLAAQSRGRSCPIAVRLPVLESACKSYGFDPVGWAKEGLAQVFTFSDCGSTADFDIDAAGWRARLEAVQPNVRVLVGTDTSYASASRSKFRGLELSDLAVLRGWLQRYVEEPGGLYFFNPAYLPQAARNEMFVSSLSADRVNFGPRRFPMTFHDAIGIDADGRQWWRLPTRVLAPLELTVQAVPGPYDSEAEVVLGFDAEAPDAAVTLNGVAAEGASRVVAETKPYSNLSTCVRAWRFPVSAVRKGANAIAIPALKDFPAQVVWCEISLK